MYSKRMSFRDCLTENRKAVAHRISADRNLSVMFAECNLLNEVMFPASVFKGNYIVDNFTPIKTAGGVLCACLLEVATLAKLFASEDGVIAKIVSNHSFWDHYEQTIQAYFELYKGFFAKEPKLLRTDCLIYTHQSVIRLAAPDYSEESVSTE